MNLLRLLLLLLPLAACSRAPDAPASYRAADGSFTAVLPGDWKVDEAGAGARKVAFYGPPGGEKPFSQVIAVAYHRAGKRWASAAAYVAYLAAAGSGAPRPAPAPGALEATFNRARPALHGGPVSENGRVVAIEVPGGFFALEHAWPLDAPPAPEFDAFRASFKPKSK